MHILFFNPQGNFDRADSHLTEHPDFGGQLVYVKEVAMAMVAAGHQVDIVTRRIRDPEWPEFASSIDFYDDPATSPRIVRIPCGGDRFLPKEQLWKHLPEFIDNTLAFYGPELPDFTTAHYADGGYCAALMQAATGLGFTFTGHSLGAQKMDKLGANSSNEAEMERRFVFSRRIDAERLSMQRAWRVVTSTHQERMEQYAHPLYQGAIDVNDDSRFRVIPPGVNLKVFNTEGGEIDRQVEPKLQAKLTHPERPHFLISSRIDEKKNIGNAVAAWLESPALIAQAGLVVCVRGVDDPWTDISALSPDEQQVLTPILQMIDAAGLRNQVDFLNIPSQAELAATYRFLARHGSVFVLPSVYEPFGLAPIEAAACGLACVATRNGGPTEIFQDGSGVLVDPFDIADIARGLGEALERREDLATRGRNRVLSTYTWDKTAAAYLEVIEEGRAEGPGQTGPVPDLDGGDRISKYLKMSDP